MDYVEGLKCLVAFEYPVPRELLAKLKRKI
jgi:hypothetical protein